MNSTINLDIDGFPSTAIAISGVNANETVYHALQFNGLEIGATLFLSVEQLRKVVQVVDAYLRDLPGSTGKVPILEGSTAADYELIAISQAAAIDKCGANLAPGSPLRCQGQKGHAGAHRSGVTTWNLKNDPRMPKEEEELF